MKKIGQDLHPISMQHMSAEKLGTGKTKSAKRHRREFEKDCVRLEADAVCATSMSSGGPVLDGFTFKLILVDEAAQSTEPESLVPLCQATDTTRVQLIGDHQQLPPVLHSQWTRRAGLGVSLFERLFMTPGIPHVVLDMQYRMHPTIAQWPSTEFYQGAVSSHPSTDRRPFISGFPRHSGDAVAFIHVGGQERREGNSYDNQKEALIVRKVLEQILPPRGHVAADQVGIITPYEAQQRLLVHSMPVPVAIASVDSFQGQEKDLIVLSTVRAGGTGIGFVGD